MEWRKDEKKLEIQNEAKVNVNGYKWRREEQRRGITDLPWKKRRRCKEKRNWKTKELLLKCLFVNDNKGEKSSQWINESEQMTKWVSHPGWSEITAV